MHATFLLLLTPSWTGSRLLSIGNQMQPLAAHTSFEGCVLLRSVYRHHSPVCGDFGGEETDT